MENNNKKINKNEIGTKTRARNTTRRNVSTFAVTIAVAVATAVVVAIAVVVAVPVVVVVPVALPPFALSLLSWQVRCEVCNIYLKALRRALLPTQLQRHGPRPRPPHLTHLPRPPRSLWEPPLKAAAHFKILHKITNIFIITIRFGAGAGLLGLELGLGLELWTGRGGLAAAVCLPQLRIQ